MGMRNGRQQVGLDMRFGLFDSVYDICYMYWAEVWLHVEERRTMASLIRCELGVIKTLLMVLTCESQVIIG